MDELKPRTRLVHEGTRRSQYGETSEALFLTQSFVYPSAEAAARRFETVGEDEFIYSRYANPTVRMFEERMAGLEGAEDAFATASGMAAVFGALASGLSAGSRIVASRALFGSCLYILREILPRYGVETELVDGRDLSAWEQALSRGADMVFLESVSNPTLEVIDLDRVAKMTHGAGALLVVDNVFATPVLSAPLAHGADVVVYSTTKHVDGQGRCLGGVILGREEFVRGTVEPFMKHTGASMSPFNAWVMLKGLETLDLRVRAQAASARHLAERLEGHPALVRVLYPALPSHPDHALAARLMEGGGTVFSIVLRGGRAAAFRFLDALRIVKISNNLGDARSLATHPASTTHQRLAPEERAALGIDEGLVRISVGLEDTEDLAQDLEAALAAAEAG